MLEIEIDGKNVQIQDGSTIMEAATAVGAYVPHFCYHKKLSIAANCRMCLVQVEKAPKPLPACATPVTNGMKVWTHSEQAVKAQKGVMEFLLINHPLDCPICDQGGECQLQDLSVGYGSTQSRYQEEKRVVSNKDLGSLVATDMTRCINCTRCVRFTSEIAGLMELGQAYRGEHAEIMPFVEKTLETELSGNIIDLCPVGALTSKPFRFGARAWEMSRRKSVSPHDSLGSNLVIQVKHDQVKRVLPLENESLNECWLSDKDRFSYQALSGDGRLTRPMVKQEGKWIEVDWHQAVEYVVGSLKSIRNEHGPESIGALASPHLTLEELSLLRKLMDGLGSDNIDFRLRQRDFASDERLTGAPWLGMKVEDIGALDNLLLIGSFFRKDHPLVAQRVRQAIKRGLRLSAVNPAFDDWHMPIANKLCVSPSQMVMSLARIAKALSDDTGRSLGLEFVEACSEITIDEVSRAISRDLCAGNSVAVWLGNYSVHHENASLIHALAGEIARLSKGRLGVVGDAANSVGGYLAGAVPFGNGRSGKNVVQMLESPLKAYVVAGVEPDLDINDGVSALAALKQAETVIVLSSFRSDVVLDLADVILPISPFSETAGTFVNCEGVAQSFFPVVKSAGDSRPGWKVLRVIGDALGIPGFDFDRVEDVRSEVLNRRDGIKPGNEVFTDNFSIPKSASGLERVADIPIYFTDPLVRRATSLQATPDAEEPVARMNARTIVQSGLQGTGKVRVKSLQGEVVVLLKEDEGVADNCVRLAGGHPNVFALGGLHGELCVERI